MCAGSAAVNFEGSTDGQTIALAAPSAAANMYFDDGELSRITATGATFGDGLDGTITVSQSIVGVSHHISDVLTFYAATDDARIRFMGGASVFHGVAAQADNGVDVTVDLTSTASGAVGYMNIDGDLDEASTDDANNKIDLTGSKGFTGCF